MRTASEKEFSLARADCKLQGTANSPPSTAFLIIPIVNYDCNGKPCIHQNEFQSPTV